MKKLTITGRLLLFALVTLLSCNAFMTQASAATQPTTITVGQTPSPSIAPDFIITSIIGSALPQYIELFNQGDAPLDLDGWTAQITIHDTTSAGCADVSATIPLPNGWVLPKKYLTLERTDMPVPGSLTAAFGVDSASLLTGCVTPVLNQVALINRAGDPEQTVTIPVSMWSSTNTVVAQHKQRSNSPSSTRAITGTFDTDYRIVTGTITLNSDPLYIPPLDTAGLQILEILPNARSCSPLETDPTCNDYVKLYNQSDLPIDLAQYRLRIGTKGQGESITNTFTWNSDIDPATDELVLPAHQYFMLTSRNDGLALSITDSGNYVWVEDAYGTTVYQPIVQYPDASSTTKVGQAWAYDGATWQWTAAPQPGLANYFPPAVLSDSVSVSAVSTLKPCADNQYRNPDTNRCNTVSTAVAVLTPCGSDEERNPETNRCRSIVTASAQPAPCPSGSERNPDTNRCRKIVVTGAANTIKDVAAPSVDNNGWFVAALVTGLALAYAIYEWRQDIRLLAHKARDQLIALPERFRR